MSTPYLSKPGKHGALYLWRVQLDDVPPHCMPSGAPPEVHRVWAYSEDHACELVWDRCHAYGDDWALMERTHPPTRVRA
jgi:hypothetical protein